jgi:hypothetical protein
VARTLAWTNTAIIITPGGISNFTCSTKILAGSGKRDERINEEVIEQPVTYVNTRGQTWTYALWRMMLHLLNHQSYHRGQVTTLLRQLEVQPAQVDFLVAHDLGFK